MEDERKRPLGSVEGPDKLPAPFEGARGLYETTGGIYRWLRLRWGALPSAVLVAVLPIALLWWYWPDIRERPGVDSLVAYIDTFSLGSNAPISEEGIYVEHWTANPTNETEVIASALSESLHGAGLTTTQNKSRAKYVIDVEIDGTPALVQPSDALQAADYEVDLTVNAKEEPGDKVLLNKIPVHNEKTESDLRSAEGDALEQAVKQITRRLGNPTER